MQLKLFDVLSKVPKVDPCSQLVINFYSWLMYLVFKTSYRRYSSDNPHNCEVAQLAGHAINFAGSNRK